VKAARLLPLLLIVPLIAGAAMSKDEKIKIYDHKTKSLVEVDRVEKSDAEWKKILTPKQYEVLRDKGTERAFSNQCAIPPGKEGIYVCAGCGTALFDYSKKFESGTGWPSFFTPIHPNNVRIISDRSHGMTREEVVCARCGGHLGHVFDDGPPPTGKRYCINAVSLDLAGDSTIATADAVSGKAMTQTATFAAGCFWGIEKYFGQLPGVASTRVGYTGGSVKNPSYERVCDGTTGHAEAIEVVYDPAKISYGELLEFFFTHHDPTQLNKQGNDVGTQYRSAVFYHTPEQEKAVREAKELLGKSEIFKKPVVTEIAPAREFYAAEDYHQKYLEKNPHGYCHINLQSPKVKKLLQDARAAVDSH